MEDGGLLILQLLFLLFLIALNAFFASSEVALISLKPATVRRLGSEGGSRGRRLAALVENSGRFLATVQVGVTFAGFMASAFAAESFSDPVTLWLEQHGFTLLSHATLDALVVLANMGKIQEVRLGETLEALGRIYHQLRELTEQEHR